MSSIGWRAMRAGSGKGAVLSLDFTVAQVRAQASFAALAPQLPEGYPVWGTEEAAWPTAPGVPRAQLDDWLDRGCEVDTPVRAVFGFCGAAALAMVLADRLTGSGAPAVVLFDPVLVGPGNLVHQADQALRHLPPAGDPGDGDLEAGDLDDGDLDALVTRLAGRYATRAAAVGTAQSIPAPIVTELCARVETNLRYLALCATARSYQRTTPDLLVLSRDLEVPAPLSDTPQLRLDVTQNELLAHPEAAQAAARVLAGVLVDGRS